ncbi:MAG: TonB-dependent receptor [Steroidobacteraceae bacterium]
MRTGGPFVCCLLSAALYTATLPVKAADNADDGATDGKTTTLKSVTVESSRDGDFLVDESTVGAKFPTPARDIPQQVTVIPQELIATQADISLYRALDNVPGIVLTPSADTATGNNINLRGFPARTDIYLDGIRDRGQYFRDTFALERVEVLEGAASLLFGHGSTGGIINQVTKKPQLQPMADVSASVGTDRYYRGLVDVGAPLDQDSAFRLLLMDQDLDGTRPSVNTRSYGVAPSLAFGIGSPTEVSASWLTEHNNDRVDYGFPMFQFKNDLTLKPLQAPFGRSYQYTNSMVRTDVNIFNFSLSHTFAAGIVFRSNTQYGVYNVHQNTAPLNTAFEALDANGNYQQVQPSAILAPPTTPLSELDIAPQQKQRTGRDSSLFNQTDLLLKFTTGPIRHALIVGGEIGRDEYNQVFFNNYNFNLNNGTSLGANLAGVINLGSTNTQPFPSGANVYQVPGNVTDIGADTVAFYFNDTLSFGEHWKLVAGLRRDDFDASQTYTLYNYPGLITTNTSPSATATVQAANAAALTQPVITSLPFQHRDEVFSPRAGLIWQPTDWQSYYVSYSTAFNPQAIEGSATTGQLPTSLAQIKNFVQGGGLKPEATRVAEIGAKLDLLNKRLSLSSALFDADKFRTRFTDPDTGYIGVNGKERVIGAELKLVGHLAPAWQTLVAYTWLDGKILSSPIPSAVGQTLPELARSSAAVWTTYDFGALPGIGFWGGRFQLGGGLKYSSRQYVINSPFTLYGSAPGYTRFDATAAYVARKWDLRLNLENVFNREYYGAVNAGRAIPGEGRRATMTVRYHFFSP